MFREIAATEISGNLIDRIANEWMLVSAGGRNSYNMMTASWGFAGEMWGKHCAACVIRPQRYTLEFVEREENFALSFYGENKGVHKVCGSTSGRTTDKTAAAGLTSVFSDGTVYFEEAELVLICKKLYVQDIREDCFLDRAIVEKWYPEKDFHRMFVGEIVKVLVKE